MLALACASVAGAGERYLTSLERELGELFERTKQSVVTVRTVSPDTFGLGLGKKWPGAVASGVVLNAEGYILTTSQISDWTGGDVSVELSNGRELDGEVVGTDPLSNMAVVKVDVRNLKPAVFGDSDRISAGSWIIIQGNSFGVSPSITFGMVNGVRDDGLLQVSANASPGSGGSPVFSSAGEVIGILNATLSQPFTLSLSAGEEGEPGDVRVLSYPSHSSNLVTPINDVLQVANELIQVGRVERGWLGVVIQDLDAELREGLEVENGIIVKRVVESSPADEGGLEVGDVILEFGGEEVKSTNDFRRQVMRKRPGERVSIVVARNGDRRNLRVQISSRGNQAVDLHDWAPFASSLFDEQWRNRIKMSAEELLESSRDLELNLRDEVERLKKQMKELMKRIEELSDEER
jgi:serine protease Do